MRDVYGGSQNPLFWNTNARGDRLTIAFVRLVLTSERVKRNVKRWEFEFTPNEWDLASRSGDRGRCNYCVSKRPMHKRKCCGCTVKTAPDDFSMWLANKTTVKCSASARCNECKASSLAAEKRQREREVSLVVKESYFIFAQDVESDSDRNDVVVLESGEAAAESTTVPKQPQSLLLTLFVCTAVQEDQLI